MDAWSGGSPQGLGARQQGIEIQVDAGYRPIWLLCEWLRHIERPFALVTIYQHEGGNLPSTAWG